MGPSGGRVFGSPLPGRTQFWAPVVHPMILSCPGLSTGSVFRNTAFTALKIAVVPPMPIPNIRIATRANAGFRRN